MKLSSSLMAAVAFLVLTLQACDEASAPTAHSGLAVQAASAELVDKGRSWVLFSAEQVPATSGSAW
jgi:hypothetical protein